MKRTLLTILSVLFCAITFAQSVPQGINYQAVARDASGAVLMNQALTIQFSVISDITTSAVSWQETHIVTTNDYGLYTAIIGQGTATSVGSSASFDVIDWGASNHLLKVEVDYGGGIFVDMGTTAFMSVPYAINSTPQSLTISGDTLFISSGNSIVIPGLSLINSLIIQGCTDLSASNYNAAANTDNGSCIPCIYGCMDSTALNYNSVATCDDGICILPIYGCMDSTMWNYNPLVNVDDGSCEPFIYGCNDASAFNYNSSTNTNDGSCCYVGGCTDPSSIYFDSLACYDDGSCTPNGLACDDGNDCTINDVWQNGACVGSPLICDDGDPMTIDFCDPSSGCQNLLMGCTDLTAFNYDSLAVVDDGSCIAVVYGCTDSTAFNYNLLANTDDGSCIAVVYGCTDSTAFNYNLLANTDDGSCIAVVYGCTDSTAFNYNLLANTDDGSCIAVVYGCTDSTAFNYNLLANTDDGSCIAVVYGCTDSTATNYDPLANTDDGSCIAVALGCTDSTAFNYNANANTDDGSCIAVVYGCTDSTAFNYDPSANTDDGSCASAIGDNYQGGIIFYLNGNGGGLLVAPTDQSSGEWGCYGTAIPGADGIAIGAGAQNTIDIEAGCTTTGIAADICANLTLGGYNDWFLPSKDELNEMYVNKAAINTTAIANGGSAFVNFNWYWSSTEDDNVNAWKQDFGGGYWVLNGKNNSGSVRAVRAFGTLVSGCTDSTATNYNAAANTDDGSCIAVVNGCTDPLYTEYDLLANTDDGSCATLIVNGCTDVTITVGGGSYDHEIGWSLVDASGVTVASGGAPYSATVCLADDCYTMNMTDSYGDGWNGATYTFFNSGAVYGTGGLIGSSSSGSDNISIGGVACLVYGCTDSTATNYDPLADTDDGSCCFNGICVGSTYQGGIIFWLDGNGGGLIAAPSDQSSGAQWGCYGTLISGADGTAIGTGNQNTIDIEAGCTTTGIAADICANLTLGGYSDWFLPSKDELNKMYLNIGQGNALGLGNVGGFANYYYWSSTEDNADLAKNQSFTNGYQHFNYKNNSFNVRAVRAF